MFTLCSLDFCIPFKVTIPRIKHRTPAITPSILLGSISDTGKELCHSGAKHSLADKSSGQHTGADLELNISTRKSSIRRSKTLSEKEKIERPKIAEIRTRNAILNDTPRTYDNQTGRNEGSGMSLARNGQCSEDKIESTLWNRIGTPSHELLLSQLYFSRSVQCFSVLIRRTHRRLVAFLTAVFARQKIPGTTVLRPDTQNQNVSFITLQRNHRTLPE